LRGKSWSSNDSSSLEAEGGIKVYTKPLEDNFIFFEEDSSNRREALLIVGDATVFNEREPTALQARIKNYRNLM